MNPSKKAYKMFPRYGGEDSNGPKATPTARRLFFCHTTVESSQMPFSPDIIVTEEDTPRILLIVEAKLSSPSRPEYESQLKSYMLHMRCPTGLFVTPDAILVYRDTYTAHSEKSVERAGPFPAPKTWTVFKVPHHGSELPSARDTHMEARFEETVKSWLEQVRNSPSDYLKEFPKETRDALTDYVVPALSQGVIRGSGPREWLESR